MTGMPMVLADRVSKNFGSNKVLRGIRLEVNPGEVLCVVGPSGSGKSTFLRCINHLERVDAGRLSVDGELVGYRQKGDKLYELKPKEAAFQRQEIGMVFQRGQQQRVAIARALAMDPKLMLFDEPTSALDPEVVGDVESGPPRQVLSDY